MDSDKVIKKYEILFKKFIENTRLEVSDFLNKILKDNEDNQIKMHPVSNEKLTKLSDIEIINKEGLIGIPEHQNKNIKIQEVFGPKPWLKFKEILNKNLKKVK